MLERLSLAGACISLLRLPLERGAVDSPDRVSVPREFGGVCVRPLPEVPLVVLCLPLPGAVDVLPVVVPVVVRPLAFLSEIDWGRVFWIVSLFIGAMVSLAAKRPVSAGFAEAMRPPNTSLS